MARTVTLCIMVWARPGSEEDLLRYEDSVIGFLGDHGGSLHERWQALPADEGAPGVDSVEDPPFEIQVLDFPSQAAFKSFLDDPRRMDMSDQRHRASRRTDVFQLRPG